MSFKQLSLFTPNSLDLLVDKLKKEELGWQVVYEHTLPGQAPDYLPYPEELLPVLKSFLEKQKLKLYSHQVKGIEGLLKGEHICLATPTASGKSLVYNLPVLQKWLQNPEQRALYIFPLKALAQDQVRVWQSWKKELGLQLQVELYDGDTSAWKRSRIRSNPPHILVTNPDMLHLGILPHFELWVDFLKKLKFVVVDEVHTYRGIFGSHLAWVFRRLKRICSFLDTRLQFVFSSATIANPEELVFSLAEIKPRVIDQSGAKRGEIRFVFLKPFWSASKLVLYLLQQLEALNLRTIVFTKSRRMTELLFKWGKGNRKILPYRAGYRPEQRRKIEQKLFQGEISTVVATSALELGVDIGHLDVCVILGYPGSIMSTWQRIGRIGRKGQPSLVLFIGLEDALDEYFLLNPTELIYGTSEKIRINPFNPYVLKQQLPCLVEERELTSKEYASQPEFIQSVLNELWQEGRVLKTREDSFISSEKRVARKVSLRGTSSNYNLFDQNNNWLGDIDGYRVYKEAHPGAVYVHLGKSYLVLKIDEEKKMVFLKAQEVSYYTRALTHKEISILEVEKQKKLGEFSLFWGKLRIREEVIGYEKRLNYNSALMGRVELDLPPLIFSTEGFWLTIPSTLKEQIEAQKLHFMGGIHGLEHLLIGLLPLLVLSDRNDFGGISLVYEPGLQSPAVFVYDAHPGGAGLTEQAFAEFSFLTKKALHLLASCDCSRGCPLCIQSPKCGSGNRPLDKQATLKILEHLADLKGEFNIVQQKAKKPRNHLKKVKRVQNFVVFDLETRRSAQEVGGWSRASKMGVSVLVAYFSARDEFISFEQEEIGDFWRLLTQVELVIGFNVFAFDYQVLRGVLDKPWSKLPTLDILQEVKKVLGYRISLDNLARHTLGAKKSAHGLLALEWWKQGEVDKIKKYCEQDVYLTRELYLFGREKGYLYFQNKAKQVVRFSVYWE